MFTTLCLNFAAIAVVVVLFCLTLALWRLLEHSFNEWSLRRSIRKDIGLLDTLIADAEAPFVKFGLPADEYMVFAPGYWVKGPEQLIKGNPLPRMLHFAKYFRQMASDAAKNKECHQARIWLNHAKWAVAGNFAKLADKNDAGDLTDAKAIMWAPVA